MEDAIRAGHGRYIPFLAATVEEPEILCRECEMAYFSIKCVEGKAIGLLGIVVYRANY